MPGTPCRNVRSAWRVTRGTAGCSYARWSGSVEIIVEHHPRPTWAARVTDPGVPEIGWPANACGRSSPSFRLVPCRWLGPGQLPPGALSTPRTKTPSSCEQGQSPRSWCRRRCAHRTAGEDALGSYLRQAAAEIVARSDTIDDRPTGLPAEFEALRWFHLPPACLYRSPTASTAETQETNRAAASQAQ
jgi:hypothetical protein